MLPKSREVHLGLICIRELRENRENGREDTEWTPQSLDFPSLVHILSSEGPGMKIIFSECTMIKEF
jgi:hypothetical protein